MAQAERHFSRRIAAIRDALDLEDFAAADRHILTLAAIWTPAGLGTLLSAAMELAAFEGREAALSDGVTDAAFAQIDVGPQEFRQQIDFLSQKRGKPTRVWTDALRGDHDRAFVVAGVTDMAMLDEFRAAMIEGAKTYDIQPFAAEFDRLVEKYGWSYKGGRTWRIRTIFETNIRTSYMAGRLRQMRDPDMVKLRPYWQYIHADTRVPLNPRPEHLSWNKIVLRWDDPWWDTHFPPNDWACSCGVRTLSRGDLRRLGKDGPDPAPEIILENVRDPATGQMVQQPRGIGFGWNYMPGDRWERGLVPSALLDDAAATALETPRGQHAVSIDTAEPIADLVAKAKPFAAEPMQPGLPITDYVTAFLRPFGAEPGSAVLWQDASGARIVISEDIFREQSGAWKGSKRGHAEYAALLAEVIMDPDEIWLGVREVPVEGHPGQTEQMITRRYVRVDPKTALQVMFEIGRRGWLAITGYASFNRSKPDFAHIDKQRVGKLLWKRK